MSAEQQVKLKGTEQMQTWWKQEQVFKEGHREGIQLCKDGGLGSARFMVGLDNPTGLFQPKQLYDSTQLPNSSP